MTQQNSGTRTKNWFPKVHMQTGYMCPYASLWVLKGPYRSLFIFMDSNGSLSVFVGPYAFLCVLMGP